MLSKRSFFNAVLFKKNLSRSWPLWGGVTAVGCLVPLYLLLALLQMDPRHLPDGSELAELLYTASVYFVPAASFVYALLVAMVVWSYLYSARSVGLMHTLPVDRTALFVTNTLSGLAMLLIPYVAVGGFVCLLALAWGFMDLPAVLTTVAAVLLMTVLFFGMATFFAMITGNIFALPVFYLVGNFLAPGLDALFTLLSRSFLVGVSSEYTGAVEFLAPLMQIYRSFRYRSVRMAEGRYESVLEGFGVVVLYGLVGVAFFALAWLMYQKRASESAGSVVAFRWLRPIFRYGVSLCFAITTGHALYALIWGSLFQKGSYAQLVPMAVCMALTGLVGYYIASMLLEKSLRVFRGSARGAAFAVLAALLICGGARMDILGLERYVPELEEVESIYVYTTDMIGRSPNFDPDDDPALAEKIRVLHTTLVDHVEDLREMDRTYYYGTEQEEGRLSYQNVTFRYILDDGSSVRRSYDVCLSAENWEENVGIEGAYRALMAGPELQSYQIGGSDGGELFEVRVHCHESERSSVDGEWQLDQAALHRALQADVEATGLYDYDFFDAYYNDTYPVSVELEYRTRLYEDVYESYEYNSYYLQLRPTMEHTIRELIDQGFITWEEIGKWNEELTVSDEIVEKYGLMPQVIGGADGPTHVYVTG